MITPELLDMMNNLIAQMDQQNQPAELKSPGRKSLPGRFTFFDAIQFQESLILTYLFKYRRTAWRHAVLLYFSFSPIQETNNFAVYQEILFLRIIQAQTMTTHGDDISMIGIDRCQTVAQAAH